MDGALIELDPVDRITADAVGPPGQRIFFLQARKDDRLVTLLVEKQQVQLLAASVVEILYRLGKDTDEGLPEEAMGLEEPLVPEWRAGRLSIEYEEDRDAILLEIEELVPGREEEEDEDDEGEEDEGEDVPEVGIEIPAVDLSEIIREQEEAAEPGAEGSNGDGDEGPDDAGEDAGAAGDGGDGGDGDLGLEGMGPILGEDGPDLDDPDREPARVRLWASREQMLSLARHGASVCAKGRPRCQLCGNPIDPEGHTCPMLNGHHKRTAR